MHNSPGETNVTQLVLGFVVFIILATALLTLNTKLKQKNTTMKVGEALLDPRVREGALYFRARDPGAYDPSVRALYRLYSDSAQELLGAGRWTTLQKLIDTEPGFPRPRWYAVGGNASIDWLPEEAELVEPTKEMP